MKLGKNSKQDSITQPLIQDLNDREAFAKAKQNPTVGSEPLAPASLYQDSGNGYNANLTFPQA